MLTIRDPQLVALRLGALQEFTDRTAVHLLTHFPAPCAALGGPAEVRAFVVSGIQRAAQFRVDTKGAITVLLELWIQFGENFEHSPLRVWSTNILGHPTLPAAARVEAVRDRHQALTGGCVMVTY